MRNIAWKSFAALLLVVCSQLTGCSNFQHSFSELLEPSKKGGSSTSAGNPGALPTLGKSGQMLASRTVLDPMCSILTNCFGMSTYDCEQGIAASNGPAGMLGLNPSYGDFRFIMTNEYNGTLVGNLVNATNCVPWITSLSCTDLAVQNAYIPGNADPYFNSKDMLADPTGICILVF